MLQIILILLSLLLCASPAHADTLTLISGSANDGQYYVGPLTASLNGQAIPGGITCLDTGHESYLGTSWQVAVHRLPDVAGTMFADLLKYQEAAWLLSQFAGNPGQIIQIQYSIWDIFHPGSYTDTGTWLTQAQGINPADYNFASVVIYTPVGTGIGNQEFMSGGASKVPLPATWLLLGSGLLGMMIAKKRGRGDGSESDL